MAKGKNAAISPADHRLEHVGHGPRADFGLGGHRESGRCQGPGAVAPSFCHICGPEASAHKEIGLHTPGTKDRSHVHTESTEHTRTGPRTHAGGTGQTRADTHPQSTEVRLPRADHHAWRDAHAATRSTAQHEQGAPGAPRAQSSTAAQKTSPEGGLRKTRPFPVHLARSLSRAGGDTQGRWPGG